MVDIRVEHVECHCTCHKAESEPLSEHVLPAYLLHPRKRYILSQHFTTMR